MEEELLKEIKSVLAVNNDAQAIRMLEQYGHAKQSEVALEDLHIEFQDWDHTCGDGCCYNYGTDIYLNGEKLDEQHAEDSRNALRAILEKLGYKVEFNQS